MFKTEAEFQRSVVELARMMGLLVYHTHDSRRSDPGFPDLVIVGKHGVLFRELKTDKGRVRPEQKVWIQALIEAGENARIWRPSEDWPGNIKAELAQLGHRKVHYIGQDARK